MPAFNIDRELNIKADLEGTGNVGTTIRFRATDTWKDIQEALAKARDLPIRRPARPEAFEYHLEALLPPGLQLNPRPPPTHPQDEAATAEDTAGSPEWAPNLLQVADETAWHRLQRLLPGSPAELAVWQLRASASEARSAAYVRHLEGYTGMWEIAIATSGAAPVPTAALTIAATGELLSSSNRSRDVVGGGVADGLGPGGGGGAPAAGVAAGGDSEASRSPPLDGVWSEEEVAVLARCLAEFMRKGHLERVGAVASGCSSLATLWWLLRQPNVRVRPSAAHRGLRSMVSELSMSHSHQLAMQVPCGVGGGEGADTRILDTGSDSGGVPAATGSGMLPQSQSPPQQQQQQQPAAAFRLQLRKKDRGGRSSSGFEGRIGVGAGVHVGGGMGAPSTLLAVLLSPNLLGSGGGGSGHSSGHYVGGVSRAVSIMMRDILTRVSTTGPTLLRQYKGDQVALAAVWGVGLLSEMFRNPLLRDELMVAAQLGASQALAAAAGTSVSLSGALVVGAASTSQKRRAAFAGDIVGRGGGATAVEGRRLGVRPMSATARGSAMLSVNNSFGIELEEVHWLLLSFAAFPEWLEARSSPPWDLQPMARTQAATVIQSSMRGLAARRQTEKLRSQVLRVFPSFRAAAASPSVSCPPSPTIATLQRGQSSSWRHATAIATAQTAQQQHPPQAVADPRPSGLCLKWEGDLARMSTTAVDAMDRYFDLPRGSHPGTAAAEALLALLVAGGPLAREHFAASVHPGQLIRMLDTATVPPRVVHLGTVLLALVLRPGLGAEAFIRGAGATAAAAAAPGPPGSSLGPCFAAAPDRTMLAAVGSGGVSLILELLKWLAPLTALEAHERRLRYGASERRTYQALRSSTTRPYTSPPLVDWRWTGCGSEVSVHAASAAWALSGQLAKLWAAETATKKSGANRTLQRQQSTVGGGWGGGGAVTGAGGGAYTAGVGGGAATAAGVVTGPGIASSSMSAPQAAMYGSTAAAATAHAAALEAARAAAGPQDTYEEAAYRLMHMTVTCLLSGRIGPATHLLACGLVHMVSEPAAVPYMVRAGLIDAGQRLPDPPPPPPPPGRGGGRGMPFGNGASPTAASGTAAMKSLPSFHRMPSKPTGSMARSQHSDEGPASDELGGEADAGSGDSSAQACPPTSLPGFAGVAPHPRGVVGLLMDSDVAGFLDLALSIIGLVAQHGTPYDPIKGGLPGSGISRVGTGPTASTKSSWGSAPPAAATTAAAVGAGGGMYGVCGIPLSYRESGSISFTVPDLDHADIPARRLLIAGGWGTVCSCLASAGGLSQTVPDMAAAALMFLAKEVYLWSEVLMAQAARRTSAESVARATAEATPRRRYQRVRLAGPTAGSSTAAAGTGTGTGARAGRRSSGYPPTCSSSGSVRDSSRGFRETESSPGDGEDPLGLDPDLPCPPEVAALLRLLMGDDFRTLMSALQALTQLLGRLQPRPLQYACLTVYHLAGVPLLRNPLGKAGIVAGLVGVMRRWYDLPPSEQRAFRATGEWAMAALVRLTAEPGGERNRYRLASAHRDESLAAAAAAGQGASAAKGFFSGFGYATAYMPGTAPAKRNARSGDELVRGMKWAGGWGWGSGAGGPAGSGVEAAKAASRAAVPDDDDEMARELATNGAAPRSASDPIGLLVQLTSLRSRSRSSYVHIKMPSLLMLRQFAGERQYRVRLVTEGAGTALAAVANDSTYDGLTRAAAAALWMEVSQTPEGRDPLWWSAMAEQQQERTQLRMDVDDGLGPDGELTTRVGNGAGVGCSTSPPAHGMSTGVGEPARMRALSRMIGSMLSSTEAEQQLVGARAAAGLLCEGDSAKAIFLTIGGLGALLAVASRPLVQPGVLAAVCTGLLNLSSYVPAQVDMCQRCARLLLHINAKYTGYHGYLIAQRGLAAAAAEAVEAAAAAAAEDNRNLGADQGAAAPSRRRRSSTSGSVLSVGLGLDYSQGSIYGSPQRVRVSSTSGGGGSSVTATDDLALPASIKLESLGAVEEILYSTSGALYNLSRHPGNRDAFYRLELIVRTRGALAELAAETAARPPTISGISRKMAAAALLSGELRADMPLPSPPSRRGGLSSSGSRDGSKSGLSDSSGDDAGSGDDGKGGGGGPANAVWSISSASPFVPCHLRGDVARYVSYTSYLQEVLSRPLHAPKWGDGGGGGSSGAGDDSRSQASAFTGGGSSSLYSSMAPGGSQAGSKGRVRSGSGEECDLDRFQACSVAGSAVPGGGDDGAITGAHEDDEDDDDDSRQQLQQGGVLEPGDPAFPRLATLQQHLSRPVKTMWAPLLVDRHDGVAMPLFELRDAVTGERLNSGVSTPRAKPRTQAGAGLAFVLPWQHHHHQTHRFYSKHQPGFGAATAESVAVASTVPSYSTTRRAGGGGGAISVVSTATTITHRPPPPSATRWSPAVRRLRPVREPDDDGAGGVAEGTAASGAAKATTALAAAVHATPSNPADGTVTVRVEFDSCGPQPTAAVIRNFKPTTTPRGCRRSNNGDEIVSGKSPAPSTSATRSSAPSGTAAVATPSAISSRNNPKAASSSVTGLRRSAGNARPATAPTTRGAAVADAAGALRNSAASPPMKGATKSSHRTSDHQAQPLAPVSSSEASSVSFAVGLGRGGRRGKGDGKREGRLSGGGGDGSDVSGPVTPFPAPSMVQQVASLVGSIDTSKADRLAREISSSLASLPTSSLPSRGRSRTAGMNSAGGNVLRQSLILKSAERGRKADVGSGAIRTRRSRAMLSAASFSAASAVSVGASVGALSAASAHASSVFGLDGDFEEEEVQEEEEGDGGKEDGGGGDGRGRFGCNTPAGKQQIKDFQAPRVTMWAAVPGSKISDNLYPTYRLETGEPVHIYRRRKDRVDELRPVGLPHSSAPDATAGSYHREEGAARDLLAKAGEQPLEPDLPDVSEAPAPPRPDHSALRDPRDFTALTARLTLRPRPGFNLSDIDVMEDEPSSPRARNLSRSLSRFGPRSLVSLPALPAGVVYPVDGDSSSRAVSRAPSWNFSGGRSPELRTRAQSLGERFWELFDDEGEGRQGVDRPGMELEIFDMDWSRCIVRPRLKHLVTRSCPGGPTQVEELRAFLRDHYWWLLLIFHHYAALHAPITGDPFSLHPDAWAILAAQIGLTAEPATQRKPEEQQKQQQKAGWGPGPAEGASGRGESEGRAAIGISVGPGLIPGGRELSPGELIQMFTLTVANGGSVAAVTGGSGAGGRPGAGNSTQKDGSKTESITSLSRSQWIELLLRAAAARFLRPTEPPSPASSGGGGRGPATGRGDLGDRGPPSASIGSGSSGPSRRQLSRGGPGALSRGKALTKTEASAAAAAAANAGANNATAPGTDSAKKDSDTAGVTLPTPPVIPPPQLPPSALKRSAVATGKLNAVAQSPRIISATLVAAEGAPVPSGGSSGVDAPVGRVASRQPSVRWKLPDDALDDYGDMKWEGGIREGGLIHAAAPSAAATAISSPSSPRTSGDPGPNSQRSEGNLSDGKGEGNDAVKGDDEDDEDDGLVPDLVSAVRRLLYECFLPNVASGALVEPNNFRLARLCQSDVVRWFQQQGPLLKALYTHYRDAGRTAAASATTGSRTGAPSGAAPVGPEPRRLELAGWLELVEEGRLLSTHFSVGEARLAFVASRARYVDELAAAKGEKVDPARTRSLSYTSFLEALGRVAEMISPPPPSELAKLGFTGEAAAATYFAATRLDPALLLPPRHSAHLHTPKTRPLEGKLNQVFSVVLHSLMDLMGCKTGEQLLSKLRQPRTRTQRPKRAVVM